MEKKLGTQIKGMYLNDVIVTVVQSDQTSKETILTTINLLRLQEDEEEQKRLDEELQKK